MCRWVFGGNFVFIIFLEYLNFGKYEYLLRYIVSVIIVEWN